MNYFRSLTQSVTRTFAVVSLIALTIISCSKNEAELELPPPTITAYSNITPLVVTDIDITGTNFGTTVADVKVYFNNNVEGIVKSVTSTSITVTIPAEAYTGTVRVKVKTKEVTGAIIQVWAVCGIIPGTTSVRFCQRILA